MIAKSVFDALGAKTYVINNEPDGLNINTNCGSTHINVLQEYVREKGLDVGFAYDGDADRCIAVDENGNVVDGDLILYVCGKYLKETGRLNGDAIVTTVMSNLGLYKACDKVGMKYEKKDFPRLYGTLYAIGVNSVIWIDGEEQIEIEIGKIAKQRDMSKIEPAKRPLLNPSLELSGIYFMQELRRPVKQEEHKNIRELEEELIANLRKAEFLIAINAEQEEDGKLHIPYLKNKEDKIMQPVFTDVMEFEKFGRGKNLRVAKVTIDKLPSLMIPQANAYVINPLGINLVLNKEQIEKIAGISK